VSYCKKGKKKRDYKRANEYFIHHGKNNFKALKLLIFSKLVKNYYLWKIWKFVKKTGGLSVKPSPKARRPIVINDSKLS